MVSIAKLKHRRWKISGPTSIGSSKTFFLNRGIKMIIEWNQLNDLETTSYELQALVDVLQDAVLNETSGFNTDSLATVLGIVAAKASEIKDTVEEIYILNREGNKEVVFEEEDDEQDEQDDSAKIPTVWPYSENA